MEALGKGGDKPPSTGSFRKEKKKPKRTKKAKGQPPARKMPNDEERVQRGRTTSFTGGEPGEV